VAGLATSLGAGAATNSLAQIPDIDTLFLFGSNPTEAHPIVSIYLKKALRNGARLIVGDPRNTWMAKRADVWLNLRPGSNIALLNGMVNVILQEGWENREFIEKRTEGFEELRTKVKEYDLKTVEKLTGVSKENIIKTLGGKNYLSLPIRETNSNKDYTNSKIDETKEAESDLYLYNLLREVRKKAADRFMQSGYLICPDKILREVARLKPKSKAEMLSINGFNSRMFNKLGNDFLEAINSYKPEVLFKSENKISKELPHNIVETKKLIQKKYTLKEIADARKLSEAVISMQVETIVEFEPDTEIASLIKNEILQTILKEAEKGFENLKDLKERLPAKVTYPEIRIVVAKFKAAYQHPSLSPPHKQ